MIDEERSILLKRIWAEPKIQYVFDKREQYHLSDSVK